MPPLDKQSHPGLIDDEGRRRGQRQFLPLPETRPKQLPKPMGQVACGCDGVAQPCLYRRGVDKLKARALKKPKHPAGFQLHRFRLWVMHRRTTTAMEPNPMNLRERVWTFASTADLDADKPIVIRGTVKPFVQLAAIYQNPLWQRRRLQQFDLESADLTLKKTLISL